MDLITYALCKRYVKKSLAEAGVSGGKSAYEIAVDNGYVGTEKEWLESLRGSNGYTPYIGENGNWWINEGDTHIPATPPVIDVQVDGESVVGEDKIARIISCKCEGSAKMGIDFTTDITVGHLEAGTPISKDDTIASILYRILKGDTIELYFGSSDKIPTSVNDLSWMHNIMVPIDKLLAEDYKQLIKSGNPETLTGQYPTIITSKVVKLVKLKKWTVEGAEMFSIPFEMVETETNYIYYIPTKNYDEDEGGKTYVFTFEEA